MVCGWVWLVGGLVGLVTCYVCWRCLSSLGGMYCYWRLVCFVVIVLSCLVGLLFSWWVCDFVYALVVLLGFVCCACSDCCSGCVLWVLVCGHAVDCWCGFMLSCYCVVCFLGWVAFLLCGEWLLCYVTNVVVSDSLLWWFGVGFIYLCVIAWLGGLRCSLWLVLFGLCLLCGEFGLVCLFNAYFVLGLV